jgi:two-component system, response regulator FlrC
MRLLIIGPLTGPIAEAGKIALTRGAKVLHCAAMGQALDALRGGRGADLVMAQIGACDIAALIAALTAERIAVPVVACGVEPDTDAAVAAIEAGAREFIPLPPEADLIAAILEAAANDSADMIAAAPAMRPVMTLAARVAPSTATVLITGESGTGKEVMARHLHAKSKRAAGPFIALNCAAIPENLLESELFGHEKGAFTGAAARRIGKFEEAAGGTILLDEVSEMAPALQAKLLRTLQEREVVRVGANTPVKVDVRVLATSNRDMPAAVAAGDFREDLYYRLNVITLDLPPLRTRAEDVPALAAHFAAHYAAVNGLPARPVSRAAMDALVQHSWPGNVRELENTLHRAVLVADGPEIGPDAIMLQPPARTNRTLAQMEREAVTGTLSRCLGDETAAAKVLGISLRVLRQKLEAYEA